MYSHLSVVAWGIPEILLHIGQFLSRNDITACTCVSRSFHSVFITVLWEHVTLEQDSILLQNLVTVQSHSRHIRAITLRSNIPSGFYTISYEHLSNLILDPLYVQKPSDPPTLINQETQLVQLNPTIRNMTLKHHFSPLTEAFWDAMGTWESPRSLRTSEIKVAPEATDSFWRACSLFQDLEIDQVDVRPSTIQSGFEFSRLRSLTLEDGRPSKVFLGLESQMELLGHAPGLQCLDWRVLWSNLELEGFQQLLSRKVVMFPKLHSLRVYGAFFTDEKIASALEHAPALTRFYGDSRRAGPLTLSILKGHHFDALDTLSVVGCASFTSLMALDVMSSCPGLRVFAAACISVTDIIQSSQPWVCTRLEILEVWIAKPKKCCVEWEREVYKRISQLEYLKKLHLQQSIHVWLNANDVDDMRPLGMTLASGLGQLASLVRLRSLGMARNGQELDEEDIEFMLEHWKGLRDVRGTLSQAPSRQIELAAMLASRGIRVDSKI
ncbi:unnamed protein product [Mortierella alpina]